MNRRHAVPSAVLLVLATLLGTAGPAAAQDAGPAPLPPAYDAVVDLTFPVRGPVTFVDDYHQPRGGGTRVHRATDLGGRDAYGLPVHAAVGGTVTYLTGLDGAAPHATAGYMITVSGDDGRRYSYVHLGRDDAPPTEAYAPGIARGVRVTRGQLLGYLGHSGNASPTWPHLHFEIEDQQVTDTYGTHRMNPYASLLAATQRDDLPAAPWRFEDLPPTSVHHDPVVAISDAGITTGCTPQRYCPDRLVTRAEMATFLARALALPPASELPFDDVDADSPHADGIARVAAAGLTQGVAPRRFAPQRAVPRAQMASFLATARGIDGTGAPLVFADVDPASVHAPAIAAVAAAGIAHGRAEGGFLPDRPVSRAQMASFLFRAFL